MIWIGVKKAGGAHRRRFAAKAIKPYSAPELFAGIPPSESLKCVMRRIAQGKDDDLTS